MRRMIEDMSKVQFIDTDMVKEVLEKEKCLVIHHDDNDGLYGAYFMLHREELGLKMNHKDILIPSNYNNPFSSEVYQPALDAGCTAVVIVDYNIPITNLKEMITKFKYVIYTDHHKTTYNMYTKYRETLKEMYQADKLSFIYASAYSGCSIIQNLIEELSREKFDNDTHYLTKLIDAYDRNAEGYPEAWFLSDYLFKNYRNTPDSIIWDDLRNKIFMNRALTIGKQIHSLNYVLNEIFFSEFTKKITWEDKIWYVLYGYGNSYCFNEHINEVDGVIIYHPLPKTDKFKYSLFSSRQDVDMCAIAEKYGGGGHKSAAGFTLDIDLFE